MLILCFAQNMLWSKANQKYPQEERKLQRNGNLKYMLFSTHNFENRGNASI